MTPLLSKTLPGRQVFATAILLLLLLACGDVDPNEYSKLMPDPSQETDESTDNAMTTENEEDECTSVEWGLGCKINSSTYNITFDGLEVDSGKEVNVSLESLRCQGYDAAMLVIGDAKCSACPSWYKTVGLHTEEIHAANAVVLSACTDNFGRNTLPHDTALSVTSDSNPDYVTGDSPLKYPCRHEFTPYTMVIDLSNVTILGKDSTTHKLTIPEIIALLEDAQNS